MEKCRSCGASLSGGVTVCPTCGTDNSIPPVTSQPVPKEKHQMAWGCLGFFLPIVGLVLYLAWQDEKPKSAKAAGLGALISVIVAIILILIICAFCVGSLLFITTLIR